MSKSRNFVLGENNSLESIVVAVMDFLEKDKKMISEAAILPNGYFVQTKSKDSWKTLVGMAVATHILFERSRENLNVTVTNGKWIDKIAVAGIGFLTPLGAVTIATSALGAWSQHKLPGEILDRVSHAVQFASREASEDDYKKIFASVDPDEIYRLAIKTETDNREKGLMLLRIAAEMKSSKASIALGSFYYEGNGVEKSLRKAFEYWSKNTNSLDAETALKLADMYRDGKVTDKDLKKAFHLYKKAPSREAEQRLMELFEQGVNLPEYTRYAAESYAKRFENGQDDLLDKIISLYSSLEDVENRRKYQIIAARKGDRVLAAKIGKELFETDKAAAYPLLCSADGDSDPEIFFMRAQILETGDGTAQDIAEAKEYYQKAADAGFEPAAHNLARLLRVSVKKSEQHKAFVLYNAWAEKGDADAKYEVADMFAQGIGTARDEAKAFHIWQDLAESGYHPATLLKIAEAYRTGKGCAKDLSLAMENADKAAKAKVRGAQKLLEELKAEREAEIEAEHQAILNSAVAACENDASGESELKVARLYEAGEITEKSPKKTLEYYRLAAAKGNAEALCRLGNLAEHGNDDLDMRPDIAMALDLYERAGKLGSGEAQKASTLIRRRIKDFEQFIGKVSSVVSFTDDNTDEQTKLLGQVPMEYVEYEIPHSLFCGKLYYERIARSNIDFAEIYKDSDEINELAAGFWNSDRNRNNTMCWHYAGKLLSKGVYWPLFAFGDRAQNVRERIESVLFLCAMKIHDCIEAAACFEQARKDMFDSPDEEVRKEVESVLARVMKQAKAIDEKWLKERSQEMTFPFFSDRDAEESSNYYSLSDLGKILDAYDHFAKKGTVTKNNTMFMKASLRFNLVKKSMMRIKNGDLDTIDRWATQLERVLARKYRFDKYDPHVPMSLMAKSFEFAIDEETKELEGMMGITTGDCVLYVYCQLISRCRELGYDRRPKNIFNEGNTTDLEITEAQIIAFCRNNIDGDYLAGLMGIMLADEKILTDDFLNSLSL